jgi:predicted metal-dependent peptidase
MKSCIARLGHQCRRGSRDPELWNRAADFAINPIVLANGLKLPPDALIDPALANLSAEEIYARLARPGGGGGQGSADESQGSSGRSQGSAGDGSRHQEPAADGARPESPAPQMGGRDASGSLVAVRAGAFGEVMDAVDESGHRASEAERMRQQHDWTIAAEQAMQAAKACGREPSDLDRPLKDSRESRQDWRQILRDFVTARNPSDYRWSPPNRRHVAAGLYLPSVTRDGIGEIVVGVDTSGSIGTAELEQFAGEISVIAEEVEPERIHVVYCDAAVNSVQEFAPGEPIRLEPKGGGGTDFRPVFEWVRQENLAPACLVYLTDLRCHSYPEPPDYPVLWATDSRRTAPFGETVRIDAE